MTIGPAVVLYRNRRRGNCPRSQAIESLVRPLQSEMVRALICREKRIADPFKADCVSQAFSDLPLTAAVRIHLDNASSDAFFFDARIAARAHRYVKLTVGRKCDRPRQVPAAVLVAQAVVRKCRESLRAAIGRLGLTRCESASCELVGLSDI